MASQVSLFREGEPGELTSCIDSVGGATGSRRPGEGSGRGQSSRTKLS